MRAHARSFHARFPCRLLACVRFSVPALFPLTRLFSMRFPPRAQELDDMVHQIKALEEERAKLNEMQKQVQQQLNGPAGGADDSTCARPSRPVRTRFGC